MHADSLACCCGRTGLKGRGILASWGANYSSDPVITRVDPSTSGRSQVLVCMSNASPGVWCLPGGILQSMSFVHQNNTILPPQRYIPDLLATIFIYNLPKRPDLDEVVPPIDDPLEFLAAVTNQGLSQTYNAAVFDKISLALKSCITGLSRLMYRGYCDDPRNTDDAWIETAVHHCHLPDWLSANLTVSSEIAHWKPPGSELGLDFQWLEIGHAAFTNMLASHLDFVELCVPFCKCGRRRYDHSEGSHKKDAIPADAQGAEWRPKEMQGRTDAGNIQFIGKSTSSHFVRARMETEGDVSHVRLMLHAWGMKQPNAVISLTGGAQDFEMGSPDVEAIFQGVLRAASVTKACIVDGGTDTGVMKLMGMAIARDGHRVDLIGVANWGIVISRECMLLENDTHQGDGRKRQPSLQPSYRRKTSVMLQLENLIDDYRSHTKRNCYLKTQPNSTSGAGLDPNHRFFVLIDDGTVGKFGSEIDARGKLENVLRDPSRFEKFLCMWELAHRIKLAECSKIEEMRELSAGSTCRLIEFRDYLNMYHSGNLNAVCAIHIVEKELQSRLEVLSTSRHDRESIERSMKIWRHVQRALTGQRVEELLSELCNPRAWTQDDLNSYQDYVLNSRKLYESSQHFQTILRFFQNERPKTSVKSSHRARRPSPVSDVLGAWGEPDVTLQLPVTEQASLLDNPSSLDVQVNSSPERADDKGRVLDKANRILDRAFSTLSSDVSGSQLMSCKDGELRDVPEQNEDASLENGNLSSFLGSTSPLLRRTATVRLPHCFRCEGTYTDRITLKRWKNSISLADYNAWTQVKNDVRRNLIDHNMTLRCKGCNSKLSSKEIEEESFFPCSSCDNYFFRSRALRLRNKGRPQINCDNCGARRKLDDLLGKFVPAVMIVVQGGSGTIETVVSSNKAMFPKCRHSSLDFETLEQSLQSCTPVVVVEGSGKAADFIAFTWRHIHEGTRKCYGCPRSSCVGFVRRYHPTSLELLPASCPLVRHEYERLFWGKEMDQISEFERDWDHKEDAAKKEFDRIRRLQMRKHVSWVIELCRRKETVTIYSVHKSDLGLDYAVMRAMCKGTVRDGLTLSTVEQLQLAIEWDLAEDNLNAVKLAKREILSDDSWDVGETASDLRESLTSAMIYALKRNSWRFVELLDHAGAMLPNREVLLKSLYPREIDQFSNETVIPNRLRLIMNLPEVRRDAKQRLYERYRRGILSDDPEDISAEYDSISIENTDTWKNVTEQILDIRDPIGRYFHIEHESIVERMPQIRIAKSTEDLERIRGSDLHQFHERAIFIASYEEFESLIDKRFDREIFGTKVHVEAVMHHMGWSKEFNYTLDCDDNSNEQAYAELFVWATLMGRTQLAMIFWRRSVSRSYAHCISRALFASAVARRMAAIAGGQARKLLIGDQSEAERATTTRSTEFDGNFAAQFEVLAKRLMRKCFEIDQQSAVDAILLPWSLTPDCWQDDRGRSAEALSPLTLAGYAEAETFVDDPAFQSCLDFVWYGGLILDDEQCQSKFSDEDYILLPFSGSHIGELGFRQKIFIAIASGALSVPICIIMSFFVNWEVFIFGLVSSYVVLPISMILLSGYYFKGKESTNGIKKSLIKRIFRRSETEGLFHLMKRLWRTCVIFYTAPIVKFSGRSIHFLSFVFLYTYVGIKMVQDKYTSAEAFMHAWLIVIFLSEVRQVMESGWARYAESVWNALDLMIFVVYALAGTARAAELQDITFADKGRIVHFRDIGGYNETANTFGSLGHSVAGMYEYQFQDLLEARGLHGVVCILLWVRLLDILRIDPNLGPLVLVIISMLSDVLRFALVMQIF